jgi:hypothetical protein
MYTLHTFETFNDCCADKCLCLPVACCHSVTSLSAFLLHRSDSQFYDLVLSLGAWSLAPYFYELSLSTNFPCKEGYHTGQQQELAKPA